MLKDTSRWYSIFHCKNETRNNLKRVLTSYLRTDLSAYQFPNGQYDIARLKQDLLRIRRERLTSYLPTDGIVVDKLQDSILSETKGAPAAISNAYHPS